MKTPRKVSLLIPRMPKADLILPYIRTIDEGRVYTNRGPLVRELENRLSIKYGFDVITTPSGTSALELVYYHAYIHGLRHIYLPALTFPAPVLAACRMGLEVEYADVDPRTWIGPGVSGFGLPSVGKLLDAAGAFGEQRVTTNQMVCFSLHATKVLGCGEGGYIVDGCGIGSELRALANFGFGNENQWGTNAKMSEYSAAVALASLDYFDREPWLQLYDWYMDLLPKGATPQSRPRGVYPVMGVRLPKGVSVPAVQTLLDVAGIQTRRWYYPLMSHAPIASLISESLIGLPYHTFLTRDDVQYVCENLALLLRDAEQYK